MKIAVLGGGHGSYAAAADLSDQGHEVYFWRRNGEAFSDLLESSTLTLLSEQGERDIRIAHVTCDLADAVKEANLIVIPIPGTSHEQLAKQLAPCLQDDQVVFLPPGSFGSYVFARALKDSGNNADVSFAEAGTLPYLTRKRSPTCVAINAYATRLPTGVIPYRKAKHAFTILKQAYAVVEDVGDGLSAALCNHGPIIHPPLIMMNAAPMQHFDSWDIHNEGTQAAVRSVADKLDQERIKVREALGYMAPHFPLADQYRDDGEISLYGRDALKKLKASNDWREDISLTEHRYMLEDVELGLALFVSCADYIGIEAPIAKGLLAMGGAIVGRDFRASGRTLENLGLSEPDWPSLSAMLREGL
ncbi:MAG: glycerol-3-phosphate dehydrogenase [Gammaproteobacteria bacterium]|nr:glycerol-3-phosphate dehydrogenase [Gammaproteobacteria bacterium]